MIRASWLALFAATLAADASAQAPAQPIRGDIVQREGSTLTVKTADGKAFAFELPSSVRVSVRARSSVDAVKPGDFVATTAAPGPDGMLVSSELRIYPESMRGLGEGHHPLARLPGSTMTNATVASVANAPSPSGNTTTNATVARVAGDKGDRILRLVYKEGEVTVRVPAGLPVAAVENGDLASLVPGAHVIVYATGVGSKSPTAQRISVGRDGFVPPT